MFVSRKVKFFIGQFDFWPNEMTSKISQCCYLNISTDVMDFPESQHLNTLTAVAKTHFSQVLQNPQKPMCVVIWFFPPDFQINDQYLLHSSLI